ncbi:MAG: helical backbone metal receptor [Deltaproteobacteria bacterium]|nr:helical backbone metal receptor [Deltaproteobacteria bacterium]
MTPSATEIVAALGADPQLVGVDEFSTYPPAVTQLPRVGSFLKPDLEAIARLRPSLVIVDDIHGGAAKQLGDAGIATIECPMHTLPDVKSALGRIGERLGRGEAARAAVVAIDDAIDKAAARHRGAGARPRVLAVIDHETGGVGGLVAAGPGSWIDELLAILGAENAIAATSVRYPTMSAEDVLHARPTIIIDAAYGADAAQPLAAWRTLGDVPAVRDGRVIVMKEPYLLAPSPRVAAALADLEAALYPPH